MLHKFCLILRRTLTEIKILSNGEHINKFDNRANTESIKRPIFSELGKDIPAGIVVFLVALPLCLGTEIACRKQGAKLILLMGNSSNSFIKEALQCHLEGKDTYLTPLLAPALASGVFKHEKLENTDVDVLVDEVTFWNLEESKARIINQNHYIREQVCKDKLGLCSAFYDRKTGKVEFSPLFKIA